MGKHKRKIEYSISDLDTRKENPVEDKFRTKRIAIAVFHERVASRLEFTENLLLVTVDNGEIKSRELVLLRDKDPLRKIDVIFKLKPDIFICGGLTRMCEYKLRHSNMRLISWIQGNVDNILSLCLKNTVIDSCYYTNRKFSEYSSV
jgi:hypothetical protein